MMTEERCDTPPSIPWRTRCRGLSMLVLWFSAAMAFTPDQNQIPADRRAQRGEDPLFAKDYSRRSRENGADSPGADGGELFSDKKQKHQQQHITTTLFDEPSRGKPTDTLTAEPERDGDIVPQKPKIVVLGATGRVGQWVVRQLLESPELQSTGATVVAFCRNYDKACRVLYDDMVVANSQRNVGPKLQIVQGDLLSKHEIHREGDAEEDDDSLDEAEWLQRAKSAAAFYGTKISDYDDGKDERIPVHSEDDNDDALKEAISGCTAIISCVGSVRPTNAWTDYVARPFVRLLRANVSDWCPDERHPFYTTFVTTDKAVHYAELEQAERNAAFSADLDEEETPEGEETATGPPRIRFIRISDLCVTQKPWQVVPLVTNAVHSMVFRYQDMAEKVLEQSSLLDTVVIRPGDMVEDERPENATLQVASPEFFCSETVHTRVGREDVASLAVASALLPANQFVKRKKKVESLSATVRRMPSASALARQRKRRRNSSSASPLLAPSTSSPFHCTLGVRWAGDAKAMYPHPAQGKARDGHALATKGLKRALFQDRKRRRESASSTSQLVELKEEGPETTTEQKMSSVHPLRPYGVCVAIPVYFLLVFVATTLFDRALTFTSGGVGKTGSRLAHLMPPWLVNRCTACVAFLLSSIAPQKASFFKNFVSPKKLITI